MMFSQRNRLIRRDPRQMDKDEEKWFNEDDDDEDECADDDDEDECENYNDEDEDGSPPLVSTQSSVTSVENRLGSFSDHVDYPHHQYSSLSLHAKHSSLGSVGSPVLHHTLHLPPVHQSGGGAGANTAFTNAGSISSYNLTAATSNPIYDATGTVAFVESPFFSSLAAAGTAGNTLTGGIGTGIGGVKKKTNERKLST